MRQDRQRQDGGEVPDDAKQQLETGEIVCPLCNTACAPAFVVVAPDETRQAVAFWSDGWKFGPFAVPISGVPFAAKPTKPDGTPLP